MTNLEIQRKNIQNKIETLSILEKCEFERRLKTVINSKLSKNKLIKQHNTIQEAYQDELKKRSKNEITFILFVILCKPCKIFTASRNSQKHICINFLMYHRFIRKFEFR